MINQSGQSTARTDAERHQELVAAAHRLAEQVAELSRRLETVERLADRQVSAPQRSCAR